LSRVVVVVVVAVVVTRVLEIHGMSKRDKKTMKPSSKATGNRRQMPLLFKMIQQKTPFLSSKIM
jgi:hypothetical protein